MTFEPSQPRSPEGEIAGTEPALAVEQLCKLYQSQVELVGERFESFIHDTLDDNDDVHGVYPYVSIEVPAKEATLTSHLAYGRVTSRFHFSTTITHPELFRDYLTSELMKIMERFSAIIRVGLSDRPIPLSFALESAAAGLTPDKRDQLQHHFFTPNLVSTNDDIVDGKTILDRSGSLPLSLFPAERIDYSLHRIRHYTATSPEHFQPYILFTNYQRYVDEFVEFAREEVMAGNALALVEPGDRMTKSDGRPSKPPLAKAPQMPGYHMIKEGQRGITLINIGVGPSNAKTITDHLAVLRPHVWLMIGHCGALRRTQRLGDYVLAHAYLRDDHVLDKVLSPSIPLPALAEVQLALTEAVEIETGFSGSALKKHLRTGTVVTTDDRNWELRFEELAVHLNQSRAIAIDMESATVAANGYRYRVPYGTLLCATDRPLHGEIKLPGMADVFYQERVAQHLKIGLRAMELLRSEAEAGTLHSRKLRSFDQPLFR